jgi:glycosyltransferase involved in cell wall biosynthesis
MQFGFGFEYKGWEKSLEVCCILKQKYKDVFFTGIISSTPKHREFHKKYYNELVDYAKKLGIQNNCALILGFQKDEALYSYLKTNKVAVFPYIHNGEHQVYGVTGAARVAMSHGVPVVTSTVPMFNDLIGVCKNSDDPIEIAKMIEELWKNPKPALIRQNEYIEKNSYQAVAKMYAELIEKKIKESK